MNDVLFCPLTLHRNMKTLFTSKKNLVPQHPKVVASNSYYKMLQGVA
jgi:hypothetical protein